MTRRRMEPTKVKTEGREFIVHCRHEDTWPPTYAKMGANFEDLRVTKQVNEMVYQQLKVWERICGLLKMDPDKCVGCPNAMTPNRKGRLISLAEVLTPPSRPAFVRAKQGLDNR